MEIYLSYDRDGDLLNIGMSLSEVEGYDVKTVEVHEIDPFTPSRTITYN